MNLSFKPSNFKLLGLKTFLKKLGEYINYYNWNIPDEVNIHVPNLRFLVSQVVIPHSSKPDKLIWKHNTNSDLSLKDAYDFERHHPSSLQWAKTIWSKDFPPSKSLLVWRLMLNKLLTDENFTARGCHLPSMCSLCGNHEE